MPCGTVASALVIVVRPCLLASWLKQCRSGYARHADANGAPCGVAARAVLKQSDAPDNLPVGSAGAHLLYVPA